MIYILNKTLQVLKTAILAIGLITVGFMAGAMYHTSVSMPVSVTVGNGAQAAEADYGAKLEVLSHALPEHMQDHPRPAHKPAQVR